MAKTISDDRKVLNDGRSSTLKDIEAPLRERSLEKLRKKCVEMNLGEKAYQVWRLGNADRAKWLERQQGFLSEFDQFIDPIYSGGSDWGSALHLPVALSVSKTYHARMQSALIGIDPPFVVKSNKGTNAQRANLVQDLMRYTTSRWVNKYEGCDEFVDTWLWDWVTTGVGIAKCSWACDYTKFTDVKKVQEQIGQQAVQDPQTGQVRLDPILKEVEKEVEEQRKVFEGPMYKKVHVEDLLIVGGEGDPQKAEYVMESAYFVASDLWTQVDRGVFNQDAVEKTIKYGETKKGMEQVNQVKINRIDNAGEAMLDKTYDLEKYQIVECYMSVDVDGSGINSEIVLWVHIPSREILRATYLYRVMPTGRRPYYKIDFMKRQGATYGYGLIEMLYSLTKEIDALHNIRVDIGIISSQPFGFYRPTSSTAEVKLPIEPGAMIPLDNPTQDVYFPNLGSKTSFALQEEMGLMSMVERVSSVNDVNQGVIGGQGVTRTATGTRSLMQETNANLDVFIRRMQKGWRGILTHTFHLLQSHIEPGFTFRILGDDGDDFWQVIDSPEALAGSYDFVLEPNSAQSNKQLQQDIAQQVYQITSNPMDLQLGLVTPKERYEALKNLLQTLGVKDFSRFIRQPQGATKYTPMQMADMVTAGLPVQLDPTSDLQGFVDLVTYMEQHDEIFGHFNEKQAIALVKKQREAQAMLQALQAQQAQSSNVMQQQANAQQADSLSASSSPVAQGASALVPGVVPTAAQGSFAAPTDVG